MERLLAGPMGTLIASFSNGAFGLWSLQTGLRLEHGRIHGPLIHVQRHGPLLYLASELGQHTVLDLGVFDLDHCALLRQVWREVPIAWEKGLPVRRPPPAHHRCRRTPPR